MEKFQPEHEILSSWRRCVEKGLLSTVSSSLLCLEDNDLEVRQKEDELLVSIFNSSTERISRYTRHCHFFLLINRDEILIKKNREKCKAEEYTLDQGGNVI